ncbi:MAG TPA: tyrosine-type recombinase/integrase, partial [Planctomycetota bacterium]|nr:tyrosine-type recombinase/integrase [Planctomycetota bacterium]
MANQKHRGVKFLTLKDGRVVARWTDPVSRKPVQKDTAPMGLTNASQRRRWAIAKANELRGLKAEVALQGGPLGRVTIEKSHEQYLERFANPNSHKGKVAPLAALRTYMTERGVKDVQDLTPTVLAGWADHIRRPGNPHAVGTRNLHLLVIGAWLRWCRENGTLPRVDEERIRKTTRRQKRPEDPIEILRPAQLRELLQACIAHDATESEQIAAFVLVVLGTGMRYSEAEGLAWDEVDFAEKVIRLGSARTKTKQSRAITLQQSPTVLELLGALRLRGGRGRVFPWIDRAIAERVRDRTQRRYSAPTWTWHMLRRTCGSLLVCAGGIYGGA